MYILPAFRADWSASLSFAAAQGFGLLIAAGDGALTASPLPFELRCGPDGSPRVAFHVARGNDLARLAVAGGTWLLAVTGAHTYVSADWYASRDQVPTWLYETAQLSGPVRPMGDAELLRHLDALSAKFEAGLAPKPPWTLDRVTPGRRQMLLKAIAGIEMAVETVEGSFKLNQTKSDADHVAVATALSASPAADARVIARRMVAMRPHLDYEATAAAV